MRKILLSISIAIGLFGCKSLSNTGSSSFSDSDSPYVNEKPKVKPIVKESKKIVVKEEKVKVIEEDEDISYKYYVIIGSFKVLDNARNYKISLKEEGFIPIILENEHGLYRVSISAYNEEIDARDKAGSVRDQYEKYDDTWLLIRKM